MRKADREIKSFEEVAEVLSRCNTIRLGINTPDAPYIVPLSFGFECKNDQIILYIHGAQEGWKHTLLAKDDRACIEADLCHRFVDTGHGITCEYESVIGFGHAVAVTDHRETIHGLDLILTHCGYDGYEYDHAVTQITKVYRITLEQMTGKRRFV